MDEQIKKILPQDLMKEISLMEDSTVGLEDKLTRLVRKLIIFKGLNKIGIDYEPKNMSKIDTRIISLLFLFKELKKGEKVD